MVPTLCATLGVKGHRPVVGTRDDKDLVHVFGSVNCTTGGGGTELHAIVQQSEVVVMQMGTEAGKTPDPMARDEVKRVAIPIGAAIVAE